MKWIITHDVLEPTSSFPYRAGNVKGTKEERQALATGMPYEFRLLDDDGEVYYLGRCGDIADAYEEQAFAPLDWAAGEGAVSLEYRKAGTTGWEIL
jgi:hypothetical protein